MIRRERDISASRAEFMRGLKLACADRATLVVDGNRIDVQDAAAAMTLTIADLPPLRIALLQLPRLRVRIDFTAGRESDRLALLAHLDRAMQRGGG